MNRSNVVATIVLALVVITAAVARAGIADTPLPVLQTGNRTVHVFDVPGVFVVDTGFSTDQAIWTYFACTNVGKLPVRVGVEVFNASGAGPLNDVTTGVGAKDVAVGQTVEFLAFNAGGSTFFSPDAAISVGTTVFHGSARILSTSKNIICSCFVRSAAFSPVQVMSPLTVVSKLKQKGD